LRIEKLFKGVCIKRLNHNHQSQTAGIIKGIRIMSMAKQAIAFGVGLIVLSLICYVLASSNVGVIVDPAKGKASSVTLFIPAIFGVLLAASGAVALKDHLRKHAMHAAAAIALLGALLAGGRGASKLSGLSEAISSGNWLAPLSVWLMTLICLAFVALCVRSFKAAAKARREAAANG
jgi:uncharacterized membrane protein